MSKEDAGNLPLSSIYSDNGVYNIPCGSINWQSFIFARADTSTDIDVLLQPPSTAIVLIYKMLEMLGSNDVGLTCYSRLLTSSSSLRTCMCVSCPRSRCKGQPYNSVPVYKSGCVFFPQLRT